MVSGLHGSRLVFMVSGRFFMVSGRFLMVPGQFLWFFMDPGRF